jgi:repressor LexA
MVEAGILDGDLVIARRQPRTEPGEIVVAIIDGEATVRRLSRRAGRLFLDAANPAHEPIPFDEKRGGIAGKVIAVWRWLP